MSSRGLQRGAFVLSREGAREIDHLALVRYGIPTIVLMENAARSLAGVVLDELDELDADDVLIVCGRGNNGGDGFAAARHLANNGARVRCLCELPIEHLAGDALVNARTAAAMSIPLLTSFDSPAHPPLVVDAVLGTGLHGAPSGRAAELIRAINEFGEHGSVVVAADIPSGLDCDTGTARGAVVRAGLTVTFAGLKQGFLELGAQAWTGDIVVADIGVPRALLGACGRWQPELEMGQWGGERPASDRREEDESGPGRRFGGSGR